MTKNRKQTIPLALVVIGIFNIYPLLGESQLL
ncbi:hypothetical protein barba126A_phanotate37 [Rheinheimera phage vB_RspM_barba_12-6A]|uniref:Uncharacterized protein n=31 Tax=Barbavirus barba18A TaxID=2734090 RepID=A0A7G9VS62_9CAUD|nr:hypothetical protein barba13A_phanotate149 [Rheinheimera phage vB_RspM_barba_1-3A]QNO01664.1 hypothetical protein barba108A_phanotate153 [Rheinheimera phage vB_RspM_barba_10-8A]QNO01791.1 hypothetical protein barba108B_phanotate120 [Rheinheimera phage vB_RspM_barba_10-8B]QNO01985.1 hypothetical protein barba108D_phanotate154 [Rheinheimera phage vB_RspM_barba_10-8D]QNO02145.1 hypothetical protein barba109A_phanotate153 [Rheinheimera phage vB_RspM_barba_10-9A]QNO02311.1 hypothetical protein b